MSRKRSPDRYKPLHGSMTVRKCMPGTEDDKGTLRSRVHLNKCTVDIMTIKRARIQPAEARIRGKTHNHAISIHHEEFAADEFAAAPLGLTLGSHAPILGAVVE